MNEYMMAVAEVKKVALTLSILFITLIVAFLFYITFKDGDHTRECERYEAARIPQDINPCWGSVRK